MSGTIATDFAAAADDIGQLLRRDSDFAEHERRLTERTRDALADDGFCPLPTAPPFKDVPLRATRAFDHPQPGATTAGGRAGARDVRAARAPTAPSSRPTVGSSASTRPVSCEAGTKPARRIIERSPSTKGDAP